MDSSSRANMPPASSWTLEGDGKLLEYMESIAKNLENRSNKTIKDMNSMMLSVDVASVDLDNAANRLQRLQQTQFIENRVQEEDVVALTKTEMEGSREKPLLSDVDATKNVMNDSLKMLGKCYKKISLEDEEEDDSDLEDQQCLKHIYKPINPYDKRTPYIICTKEWLEKWHIGLVDDSDNEEIEPEQGEESSSSDAVSYKLDDVVPKSDFDDEESSNEHENVVQVPNMISKLPEILSKGHLVLPMPSTMVTQDIPVAPPPQKVNHDQSFFRNQTTNAIPQHFTQNFIDNEPPELDNISVGNRSTQAPNLFTESDDENENFIQSTPVKPINPISVVTTPNNSNFINANTKPLDEPDRISIVTPKITTPVDKKIDKVSEEKQKSVVKSSNTSKVSNLFESDSDDDEDYFDIIRKSNKKSTKKTPDGTMSVNLVKEDSPKISVTPKNLTGSNVLAETTTPKEPINKSVQKKASNLFEDSDEDDDDFFSITPRSAISKNDSNLSSAISKSASSKESPILKVDTKADPIVSRDISSEKEVIPKEKVTEPVKIDERPLMKKQENALFGSSDEEKEPIVDTAKPVVAQKPRTEAVKMKIEAKVDPIETLVEKNEVKITDQKDKNDQMFVKSEEKHEKDNQKPMSALFESSDDENEFLPPTRKVDTTPVKSSHEKVPDDANPQNDKLSFDGLSIPPDDNSSELFSPQSDQLFFTPTEITPSSTANTTATPVTPTYRSFIDEIPPDDDFSESFDANNEFDTGYNPEDNGEDFEQSNVATDPFLFSDEPPELSSVPVVTPDEKKDVDERDDGSFKNKFKMFENVSEKSPPKVEKENKPAPKKLNVNLKINVSALLPGAKRPSPKMEVATKEKDKEVITPVEEKATEPTNVTPETQTSTQPGLLVSLNKTRIRAPTTRKPSTRKARVQSYHESTKKETNDDVPDQEIKSEVGVKVPPMSVAEMLRTAKLKDHLSRRSLNFDEVDELNVPSKKFVEEKVVKTEEKPVETPTEVIPKKEEKILKEPVIETTSPTKVSPNRKPILFDDDEDEPLKPPSPEIFKKVQIKEKTRDTKKKEEPKRKVAVFESDDDDDLFSPKIGNVKKPDVKKAEVVKPKMESKPIETPSALKIPKLFDDSEDDDDLFSSKSKPKSVVKPLKETEQRKEIVKGTTSVSTTKTTKTKSLFGSDDESGDLFGGGNKIKKPAKTITKPSSSLFGDESDDDDSLFGNSKGKTSSVPKIESSKPKQTGAIKKSLSTVVNDPLADLFK